MVGLREASERQLLVSYKGHIVVLLDKIPFFTARKSNYPSFFLSFFM